MTGCIDEQKNMTDNDCWTTILPEETMSKIWESQYFDNDEIFMESPQNVTHSGKSSCMLRHNINRITLGVKYAPCRYCDAVSAEYTQSHLKLIQQTPADPAEIFINQPKFDNLNFKLNRLSDTCSLENVDLPGNQFSKATQVRKLYHTLQTPFC